MKIRDALTKAAKSLHVDSPRKEAALLLANMLGKDRTWLLMHENDELKEVDEFDKLIQRRVENEPLEYILGAASFYSRDFIVYEGVLIPRHETEILIDKVLGLIKDIKNPCIAEIGVGSGIISTMIAILREDATIISTDINPKALENTKENLLKFGVESRVEPVQTSLLEGIEKKFDIVVSNPPYISTKEILECHVLKEPHNALFGGEVGDELLKDIIFTCKERNIPYLACEMGYDQRSSMQKELESKGAKKIEFYQDLAGLDRGFTAKF